MLFYRIKQITKDKGFTTLFSSMLKFIGQSIYQHDKYYIVELSLEGEKIDPTSFLPDIPDINYRYIKTNREADELTKQYGDFRKYQLTARSRLNRGAIAFCLYSRTEPVYINWMANNHPAKQIFDPVPFKIDFNDGAVCISEYTIPEYRKKGLKIYGCLLRYRHLQETGVKKVTGSVYADNTASLRVCEKLGCTITGMGYYTRLMWWWFWREKEPDMTMN